MREYRSEIAKTDATSCSYDGEVFSKCMDQAYRFLALREHNCRELSLKLFRKGYGSEIVSSVIEKLKSNGSIDEKRYAVAFALSSNRRHPEGKSIVMRRLLAKGTEKSDASEALDELYTDEYLNELREKLEARLSLKMKCPDESFLRGKMIEAGL